MNGRDVDDGDGGDRQTWSRCSLSTRCCQAPRYRGGEVKRTRAKIMEEITE